MNLTYQLCPQWPSLAWVAKADRIGGDIHVFHGTGVEVRDEWFCEAAWDGQFDAADFDQTDLMFGSGGRKRDDAFVFVSASHTMDRLVWCENENTDWVSNSLPALLAALDLQVNRFHTGYPADFLTVVSGMPGYRRDLAEVTPTVRLLYHDNLKWTLNGLRVCAKPIVPRKASSYGAYRDFLESSLVRCVENAIDPARQRPHRPLGTISSGFDSPTVCALGQTAGLQEAITFDSARGGSDDSGKRIGDQLGILVHSLDRDRWRDLDRPEVPFLAADAKGEDVYFAGAEDHLRDRLLLTGYAAGAWAKRHQPLTELTRADQSGLSLTEYRLWAGFLHLPLPTLGLRSGGGIEQVNRSEDMQPWCSSNAYDKPFCRRVLSEAGVDASLYAQEKKAASVLLFDRRTLLSNQSLDDFSQWLSSVRRSQRATHMLHATSVRARAVAAGGVVKTAGLLPGKLFRRVNRSVRLNETAFRTSDYDYLFAWATENAVARYPLPNLVPS